MEEATVETEARRGPEEKEEEGRRGVVVVDEEGVRRTLPFEGEAGEGRVNRGDEGAGERLGEVGGGAREGDEGKGKAEDSTAEA